MKREAKSNLGRDLAHWRRGRIHCASVAATSAALLVASGAGGCDVEETTIGSTEQDLTVCPGSATTQGIDVSHWNGTIDWAAVHASGRGFAFAKATEGTTFVDAQFSSNWNGMKAEGMVRGAYHFFRPSIDAAAQADHFLSVVGSLGPSDLIALDLEVTDGVAGADVGKAAVRFLERVKQKAGRTPLLYVSSGFFSSIGSPAALDDYPLWAANWGVSCPNVPSAWVTFKFWQRTNHASVPGVPSATDGDVFNGSLNDLIAFATASDSPMTPAPPQDVLVIQGASSISQAAFGELTSTSEWLTPWAPLTCTPQGADIHCPLAIVAGASHVEMNAFINNTTWLCSGSTITFPATLNGNACVTTSNNQGGCNLLCGVDSSPGVPTPAPTNDVILIKGANSVSGAGLGELDDNGTWLTSWGAMPCSSIGADTQCVIPPVAGATHVTFNAFVNGTDWLCSGATITSPTLVNGVPCTTTTPNGQGGCNLLCSIQ